MATGVHNPDYDPRDGNAYAYPPDEAGSYLIDFDGTGNYVMRPAGSPPGEFRAGNVATLIALLADSVPGLSVTDDINEDPDVFDGAATWAAVLADLAGESPARAAAEATLGRCSWAAKYVADKWSGGRHGYSLTPLALAADAASAAAESPDPKGGP